jgi:adenylate kinase family enzyme
MVNNKQDKPETVKRDYMIYKHQDKALKEIVKRHGESITYHVRKALDDYIKKHQIKSEG